MKEEVSKKIENNLYDLFEIIGRSQGLLEVSDIAWCYQDAGVDVNEYLAEENFGKILNHVAMWFDSGCLPEGTTVSNRRAVWKVGNWIFRFFPDTIKMENKEIGDTVFYLEDENTGDYNLVITC